MAQLQRVLANESGPWTATTGSRAMSFTIDTPAAVDLSRSFMILRTSIAIGAYPAAAPNNCIRQIGLGFQNGPFPRAYSGNCFLRDVQVTSETKGTLVGTQYNNVLQGALRPFAVSEGEQRTRQSAGEGWQDMACYFGNNGVSNGGVYGTGNYQSAFVNTLRSGNVKSTYAPYVDLIVPAADVLGSLGRSILPMGKLGRTTITFATEQNVNLASAYVRSAATGWNPIAFTRTAANTVTIDDELVRNLDGDCPFYVGQLLRSDAGVQTMVTAIEITAPGGLIQLTLSADAATGTFTEQPLDATETVTWSISEASLILATLPAPSLKKPVPATYMTYVDIPWGPSATGTISNMFSLPPGTIAAFLVNPSVVAGAIIPVLESVQAPMLRARFALDGVDLTNRDMSMQQPANSLYWDRLMAALESTTMNRLANVQDQVFSALPAAAWTVPTGNNSQLQVTVTNAVAWNAGVTHLFCVVLRQITL